MYDDSEPLDEVCERCGCCDTYWQDCYNCDEFGYSHHDCGEDSCVCAMDGYNVVCDICNGKTGWVMCNGKCDRDGKHNKELKDE